MAQMHNAFGSRAKVQFDQVQHGALSIFLPGFELLSLRSFFLGLAESFVWDWYIALVFGALYNFFVRRMA
jgi:hypothetical protein